MKFMFWISNFLNFGGLMNFYCFASDLSRLVLSVLFSLLCFYEDFWSYSYCHQTLQVLLSILMGPITSYLSLVYWMYPLNEFLGYTGCYAVIYGRNIWNFIAQLHSFFMAIFRYTCLFHGNFLLRYNLTPNVNMIN